jgi:hypothetical protein
VDTLQVTADCEGQHTHVACEAQAMVVTQNLVHVPCLDTPTQAAIRTGHLRIILPNGYELSYGDPSHVHTVPAGSEWRGQPAPRYANQ